jgi:DNA-binding MarR family transcriptional regulator
MKQERMPLTVNRPELLTDGSDAAFRRLVHDLFGFLARHETIRDGHARYVDLAGVDYSVLIAIAHIGADQDVGVKQVADYLHVSGTFITRVVNKLETLRLVKKQASKTDGRRVMLALTRAGLGRLEKLAPIQRQVNDVEFGALSRKEFLLLAGLMEKMIASSDAAIGLQKQLLRSR